VVGQNPRIMLGSATDKHPNGLANSSGLVGKYLTAHFASGTSALFDEDLQPYMGTIAAQYFSYDLYDKNAHKDKGAFGSTFMVAGAAARYSALGGVANSRLDLFGAELKGVEIAKATGAKEVWPNKGPMPTIHLMGGTIMGKTAGDSVTNSFGRTHEIGNLWIAGPRIFPTSGAPNPTYTILALSLRGAEQLAKNWGSVAG
jgi:choline dehydrogenase-like flavoprotein